MTRDLFVSSFAPTLGSGRALRTFTCVQALARLGPVDMLYVPHEADTPSPDYRALDGVDFHVARPSRGARRLATYASKRAQLVPDEACRGTSPELVEAAVRMAREPGRGRVIAGDPAVMTALWGEARRRPVIFNSHNIATNGHWVRQSALSRAAWVGYERRVLRRAAETWVVSRRDLDAARALVPGAQLRYVPNVVDVAAIRPVGARHVPGRELLMVADFTYGPNRSGRDFLVGEVLPHVWEDVPAARLTLVGKGLDDWTPPDPRVVVAGFVDDLAAAYDRADCAVVPLLEGAGTPLKFIEALAFGLPVVATALAARGLDVHGGEHYLEAQSAAEFAAAVTRVLREGAGELGARARRAAEDEYSVEVLARMLAA